MPTPDPATSLPPPPPPSPRSGAKVTDPVLFLHMLKVAEKWLLSSDAQVGRLLLLMRGLAG